MAIAGKPAPTGFVFDAKPCGSVGATIRLARDEVLVFSLMFAVVLASTSRSLIMPAFAYISGLLLLGKY